jgi:hypothetical protein
MYDHIGNNWSHRNSNKGLKEENVEAIPRKYSVISLQKTAVLGTSHIIREVLQFETRSLSIGDRRCFKGRSSREKRLVTRDNKMLIIIIIIIIIMCIRSTTATRPFRVLMPTSRGVSKRSPTQSRPKLLNCRDNTNRCSQPVIATSRGVPNLHYTVVSIWAEFSEHILKRNRTTFRVF